MDLYEALEAVRQRHGMLTGKTLVAEANAGTDEVSAWLRNKLEWDNAKAGDKYRLIQANELIRQYRVVYKETDEGARVSVRGYHSIRTEKGNIYEPAEEVAADPFKRKLLLSDMEREWKQMRARWSHFAEFAEMIRKDLEEEAA